MKCQGYNLYLPTDLMKKVDNYAARFGMSRSNAVQGAIEAFFDDEKDMALILRRLNRHERLLQNLDHHLYVMDNAVETLAEYILADIPEYDPEQQRINQARGKRRIEYFKNLVIQKTNEGRGIVEKINSALDDDEE